MKNFQHSYQLQIIFVGPSQVARCVSYYRELLVAPGIHCALQRLLYRRLAHVLLHACDDGVMMPNRCEFMNIAA